MEKEREEVEIDFLELGRKLWDNKKFIIKCSAIGAIVGLVIAFSIPKEYTSTILLSTESGKTSSGNMSVLASMAGINLGSVSNNEIFSPELYPDVLNSTPFILKILNINVIDSNQGINTSLYNYIKDEQKGAWWLYIVKAPRQLLNTFKSNEPSNTKGPTNKYFISKEELSIINDFRNWYTINTDKKTGITSLDVTTQSPNITAFLADTLATHLQTYIIEQRTKKAKIDLDNSEKLYNKSKEDYYNAQQKLASFVDGNTNVISAKYRVHQERLQNEVSTAFGVYNQMAQQVQMNKIKVQDNTPVFTIIQPPIQPINPSKPSKKYIMIIFFTTSLIGSCIWVLRNNILESFFRRKKIISI